MSESGLKIEWWPRERPIPYARNPRVAPDAAIAAASLKEFGWRQPIVVDSEGVIVAGHTRLLAAQRLGMERVPVAVASDLTAAQVKAYRLADNRSAKAEDAEVLEIEADVLDPITGEVTSRAHRKAEAEDVEDDAA